MRKLKRIFQIGLCAGLGLIAQAATAATITVTTSSLNSGQTNYWTADNTYVLDGYVYVRTNTTLVVEAGTVIRGKQVPTNAGEASSLFVARGGRIFAEGTPTRPIIFTAEGDDLLDPEDIGLYENNLWGGVVLLGRAVLNSAENAAGNQATPIYEVYEGLNDTMIDGEPVNRFGGSDDEDNSGVLRYVSIRHGGAPLPNTADKEINGLSLGAVGRGTTIEYVEVFAGNDDGFEFFGGTVNTSHLVAAFNEDEPFDTDMGYSGKNQFWFALQAPTVGDLIGENDGQHNASAGTPPKPPIANWTVKNFTAIGGGAGGVSGRFRIREYSAPNIANGVFTEIPTVALTIDNMSSQLMTNTFKIENNWWWNFNNNANTAAAASSPGDAGLAPFTNNWNNVIADPMLTGISYIADGRLDPRPAQGSPLWDSAMLSSDVDFARVGYVGAFGKANWAAAWTALCAYGVITAEGISSRTEIIVDPTMPEIIYGKSGQTLQMVVTPTEIGKSYQLQSTTDLSTNPIEWMNEGAAVAGDGNAKSFDQTIGAGDKYFRIQVN